MRDRSSRKRLRPAAARHYPGDGLFERIARAVCAAGAVPRKELHESWEIARRARRRLRGARVVDLACGHGLVAHVAAILNPEAREVLAVDRRVPGSAEPLAASMAASWPFLAERVRVEQRPLEDVPLRAVDVVLSAHACGRLTDVVLERAVAAGCAVAVLPCCSVHARQDTGSLEGWLAPDLAIDVVRALRLRAAGYDVWTQTIPGDITPKNRLLIARPAAGQPPRASAQAASP